MRGRGIKTVLCDDFGVEVAVVEVAVV